MQKNFVTVTSSYTNPLLSDLERLVGAVNITISNKFAQELFDSCKRTTVNGGLLLGSAYGNPANWMKFLASTQVFINVTFNYADDDAWYVEGEDCYPECPCETCKESCDWDMNYIFHETCTIVMFNSTWNCETVALGLGYLLFLVLGLYTLIISFISKNYRQFQREKTSRAFSIMVGGLSITPVGFLMIVLGLILWPSLSSVDLISVSMFNSDWNIFTFFFVTSGVLLVLFGLFVATLIVIYRLSVQHKDEKYVFKPVTTSSDSEETDTDNEIDHLEKDLHSYESIPSDTFDAKPIKQHKAYLTRYFAWHGRMCARHPFKVIIGAFIITGLFSIGLINFSVQTNPVLLWSTTTSKSYQELQYMNENYGPFWRIEQMLFTPKNDSIDLISQEVLNEILTIQEAQIAIQANYTAADGTPGVVTFADLCYRPIPGSGCLITTPLGYYQQCRETLVNGGDPKAYLSNCLTQPLDPNCMNTLIEPGSNVSCTFIPKGHTSQSPVQALLVFGGVTDGNYLDAKALVTTYNLMNIPENVTQALAWESAWLDIASRDYKYVTVAYSAARSVGDEITREGKADVPIVLLSYVIMFLYVSMALGDWYPRPKPAYTVLVKTRFMLGLSGVVFVLCAIIIAIGFASACGVATTLIISEALPFLVLAIGVDNIFILVDTFEKTDQRDTIENRLSDSMAEIGASITIASCSESLAFLLGAITRMPAVQAFAIYASIAVFFDYLLQITAFISLLSLDAKRANQSRFDCFPCLQAPLSAEVVADLQTVHSLNEPLAQKIEKHKPESLLQLLFRKYYAPFLLHPVIKLIVILFFLGTFCFFVNQTTKLEVGLDQRVVLPSDSYLQSYYNEVYAYFMAGTPFYVVIETPDYPYDLYDNQQIMCSTMDCDWDSIVNQFAAAPYVAGTGFSWMDDYFFWMAGDNCCFWNYATDEPCSIFDSHNNTDCVHCTTEFNSYGRPSNDDFYKYIPAFTGSAATAFCPLTGTAYTNSIVFDNATSIRTSRFSFYHTVLPDQQSYINALRTVYDLADSVSEQYGVKVFPYALWYVFFEQYLYIDVTVLVTVGVALCSFSFFFFLSLFRAIDFNLFSSKMFNSGSVCCDTYFIKKSLDDLHYSWNCYHD